MKKTLTTYEIAHELLQDENANWSRAGSLALAEHLLEYEEETGEEMELDVVAIRCDFSEWSNLKCWLVDYYGQPINDAFISAGIDLDDEEDEDEEDELIRAHIQHHGQLIEFNGGVIVSNF